ncbi:hypothetical protein BC332_12450 [Capsicum chinense]|nr:hypothetical protein BC332_12450 [Capsicum chinense]
MPWAVRRAAWLVPWTNNQLQGSIPTSLFQHHRVQVISLAYNKFSGEVWRGPWYVPELRVLNLRNNSLMGIILPFVGNGTKLLNFILYGSIPTNLGNLRELQHLFLDTNQLTNEPRDHELRFFNSLVDCGMLRYVHVGSNPLNGVLPNSIGNLSSSIEIIYIGNAHINGLIPTSIGNKSGLTVLDLRGNNLAGSIPSDVGTIPKSMERLSYLKSINVSFNDLESEIPSGGVFVNSTLQSFLGNKVWIMKRQKKGKFKDMEMVLEMRTHQLVSYHEIQRATNYFDESNLIGVGSSGSAYKGTLSSGIVVAMKILDLEYEEVCKRFDTECEVMRNVRHKNLLPVITTCSSDYIRAFVLQYMSNGRLENWLYREDSQLNLLQRVIVMLDAAMGIEYLHHGHITPIVHCDLKPANIPLDDDMVAHVGDFGISKILAVLTERRPTDEEICNENLDLRKWITQSFSGSMMDVIDDNLFPKEAQITSKSEICIASMVELA